MKVISTHSLMKNEIIDEGQSDFIDGTFESELLNVYCEKKGFLHGFGGAITEASAYNYSLLNKESKKRFLELIVGESGLRYSLFRLTIGSSDFSTHEYCYVEEDDKELKSFSIENDKKYLIPLIKDIIAYSKHKCHFLASCWSMPSFMKDNKCRLHGGKLLKEYYYVYAQYLIRYIKEYKKLGIDIEALTIQNEPKATQTWESCTYTKEEELEFAILLKEELIKNKLNIKLFGWDHNKERLVERGDLFLKENKVFDGMAFHWYSGDHFDAITYLKNRYPNKDIIETEFCVSHGFDETRSTYAHEILNNINHGANAIIEWNILLDKNGGPYHDRYKGGNVGCMAPIMLDEKNGLVITSVYKNMYMFSHFIDNESEILWTSSYDENTKVLATRKDNKVVVNIRSNNNSNSAKIYINNGFLPIKLEKNKILTIEILL